MKHFLLRTLVLLIAISASGQKIFKSIEITEKKGLNSVKNIQAIENPNNNELVIIAQDNRYAYSYLYDSERNLKSKLRAKKSNRNFQNIGYSVADGAVRIVQKDDNGYNYASVIYDFEADEYSETLNPIDGKHYKYITTFNKDDNTYIYLVKKKTSTLKIITVNIDGRFSFQEIDLQPLFDKNYDDGTTLYEVLRVSEALAYKVSMVKVDPDLPTFIEIASQVNKMYKHNEGFIWSFDGDKEHTLLLEFEEAKRTPNLKKVGKLDFGIDDFSLKSNSFLYYPNIYQITSSNTKMGARVINYDSGKELKTIELEKDDSITFKNTPIIQSNERNPEEERVMEKTSKLLRKMSGNQNGIAAFKYKDGYQLTIGGIQNNAMRSIIGAAVSFGPGGFSLTAGLNPGQVMFNLMSLETASVRIECLFDSDFNHIDDEIKDSTFDLIKDYTFKSDNTSANNLFYIDGKLVFGIYYINENKINFYEFDL
ncbi:hypothetical protein [uncultured Dokdonia sp.]|uniref:hypothetical protein n=1 Tax=uncultured Dokdonia sp. TaxID=575653 RepID=UPI002615E209|nr:hypothetical protein [uncultured Dokdonia sp.]